MTSLRSFKLHCNLFQQYNFSFASFNHLASSPFSPLAGRLLSLLYPLQNLTGLFFRCFCLPNALSPSDNVKPLTLHPAAARYTINHYFLPALPKGFSRTTLHCKTASVTHFSLATIPYSPFWSLPQVACPPKAHSLAGPVESWWRGR